MKKAAQLLFGWATLTTFLGGLFCSAQIPSSSQSLERPNARHTLANYGKLPLTFEENRGQTDKQVNFLAHGPGYSVFLTSGQMVFVLRSSVTSNVASNIATNAATNGKPGANQYGAVANPAGTALNPTPTVIELNLVGANSNPTAAGEDPQPGKVNYFIGNDPQKWQTNVPIYKQVRYTNVYPGIDVVYYGHQSRVEHDFIIAPGADPNEIRLDIKGADQVSVDSSGDLLLLRGNDEVRLQAPVLYQTYNGVQIPVTGGYVVQNSTVVSFKVGQYDKTLPLVIDPVLIYSTYLGGSGYDQASGISVDASGDAYVTGCTNSPNFPGTDAPPPADTDAFVAKLDVSGASVIYADYIGGSSYNCAFAMTIDSSDDVYITGVTYSSDFPTVNAYQDTLQASGAAFVTEVSASGSSLVYSTYLSGTGYTQGNAIGLDQSGNTYVAGTTYSTDFPTVSAYQSSASPNQGGQYGDYGFLTELATGGTSLVYSTYYGGSTTYPQSCGSQSCWPQPYGSVTGIAVDSNGNAYVTGNTNTYNFPTTTGAYQTTNATTYSTDVGFVGKFNSSGALIYSTYYGATSANSYYLEPAAIAFDSLGSAYVVRLTSPSGNPIPVTTPNLCNPAQTSCDNGFISKFDPTGATVLYSTYLSSSVDAEPSSVVVDANGDAYVYSQSYGGPASALVAPIETFSGEANVLIQEISPSGGTLLFATFMGGSQDDTPGGMAVDGDGNIYISGYTDSPDFPVTSAALQNTLAGSSNVFVAKVGPETSPAVSLVPSVLQFSVTQVGSSSQPLTSLLRNMGSGALTLSNKTVTGDFSETDTCGASLAPASQCTFSVTFTPTQAGPRLGAVTFADNAAGSPHSITLIGQGAAPMVVLSPSSLTFASSPLNQTSAAQTVTLANNGNATLDISNIAISSQYAQTNNCPAALGIGSSCQFEVTFTPTSGGLQNGTLTVTDNAPGSPHSVALTGSGYITTATITPSSLSFGNQSVGTPSAASTITITDTGSNPITITAVSVTGPFVETNNCTGSPVASSCTISVSFSPTSGGNFTGQVTVYDNAQGNPHTISLAGTGLAGVAQLSVSTLSFSPLTVGTASTAQSVTVTNTGTGSLTFSSIQASGDFSQTNNCSTVAPNGGTCTVQVTFTPTTSGTRSGTLTLTDSAVNSPQSVALVGGGIDFSMPQSGGSNTVQPGASATYQFSITPVGGNFSSAINLVCSGVPAFATCSVNPVSVTPGSNPAPVTVTLKTSGTSAELANPADRRHFWLAAWVLTRSMGLCGLFFFGSRMRRTRLYEALLLLALSAGIMFCTSCGALSSPAAATGTGTPAGTYTVLVVGSSGSVQHFTSLTLTVQ